MEFGKGQLSKTLETITYCHFLLPTDLNDIKVERNGRKANVTLGMVHGNSLKLIPHVLTHPVVISMDCVKLTL